jgi:hypothetical protein
MALCAVAVVRKTTSREWSSCCCHTLFDAHLLLARWRRRGAEEVELAVMRANAIELAALHALLASGS